MYIYTYICMYIYIYVYMYIFVSKSIETNDQVHNTDVLHDAGGDHSREHHPPASEPLHISMKYLFSG